MPNKNYIAGRAHEYAVMAKWDVEGYTTLRSAGSHGPYDVIAVNPTGETVTKRYRIRKTEYTEYITPIIGYAIQCKRRKVKVKDASNRLPGTRRRRTPKPLPALPVQAD